MHKPLGMDGEVEPLIIRAETSSTNQDDFLPRRSQRLIYTFMVIFGLSSLLPWNMIITATGFFAAKFNETGNTQILQAFPQYFQIGGITSNVFLSLLSMVLLKHIRIRTVTYVTNTTVFLIFVLITVFARLPTADWAYGFFVTVNVLFCVSCALSASYISACTATASMLTPGSVSGFYLGQGMAGLFATAISIITLSIPGFDPESAGFYYFLIAAITLLVALVCYAVFSRLSPVRHAYMAAENKEALRENENALGTFQVFRKVWPFCATCLLTLLFTLACFPAALSGLESQSQSEGPWVVTYFKPVTVFLVFNIFDVLGRCTASFINFPTPRWLLLFAVSRVVLVPLIYMCNLQPRSSPVWFHYDFIPAILNAIMAWSNGHCLSLAASYAPQQLTSKAEQALVGTFSAFSAAIGLVIGSALVFPLTRFI